MSHIADFNQRTDYDPVINAIADYVCDADIDGEIAIDTAYHCLLDTLGCGFLALQFPACCKLLGPVVPGADMPNGTPVPGTAYRLDPVKAAWDIGAMIRWLDYNDTWLAAEWGHPSDNLGGILAVADYINRSSSTETLTVQDLLVAMIKAHEIQGVLALQNSFNRVGLDHVLLVKVASTAVITQMLGGTKQQVKDAVSHAWLDGQALRTYRHAPNTGTRKSWAAGDATSRAVRLALITLKGEMGYPSVLSAKTWGFQDVLFEGKTLELERPFASYVMENVLFKITFPAEFHAQTAVEAAIQLHNSEKARLQEIERIEIHTQESGVRIISKDGPLHNPADRDHCIQYMVAIGLLKGRLTAEDYEDEAAAEPTIDALRDRMQVFEDPAYTHSYLDPEQRAIGNAVQLFYRDGSCSEKVEVLYPVGHRRRREEGIPLLLNKYQANVKRHFATEEAESILAISLNKKELLGMPIDKFVDKLVVD